MQKDDKIQQDPTAIKIRLNLEQWQQSNPGINPGDGFWKEVQMLRGRYTVSVLSRFFGIDYHRMQKGYSRGWALTRKQEEYEFAELKSEAVEDKSKLVPMSVGHKIETLEPVNSLELELMIGTSRRIRIQYRRGQAELLKELLENLV